MTKTQNFALHQSYNYLIKNKNLITLLICVSFASKNVRNYDKIEIKLKKYFSFSFVYLAKRRFLMFFKILVIGSIVTIKLVLLSNFHRQHVIIN